MSHTLTKQEIYERMKELRNLRKLHAAARERVRLLEERDKERVEQIRLLKEENAALRQTVETLTLQVEELKRMVFGRRKKKGAEEDDGDDDHHKDDRVHIVRDRASYHRPLPKDEDITSHEHHGIDSCPDCGGPLTEKRESVSYVEDITLPPDAPGKTVTKHTTESGYCSRCKRRYAGVAPAYAAVTLGTNIRLYICYLSILLRLSYEQIRLHLAVSYRFTVSDGEIANVLEKESLRLRPEYEALKDRIRAQSGVHYDETSWKVQGHAQGNHAWVMTGTRSPEVAYVFGKSRGKGVAEELKGNSSAIGITDDYGAYRTLFERHQLCWAHPHRKFRDLSRTDGLSGAVRAQCAATFSLFRRAYEAARDMKTLSVAQRDPETVMILFDKAAAQDPRDPKKLATLKESLRKNRAAYATCLSEEDIPLDNNKAERMLRHFVIKRGISFGSKTQRGADTLSVLASVVLSLYYTTGQGFFGALKGV